jgi:hypothetical protein
MQTIDVEADRSAKGRRASVETGADPLGRRLADPAYARAYREWIDSLLRDAAAKRHSPGRG